MSIRLFGRGVICALTVVVLLSFGVGLALAGGKAEEKAVAVEETRPDGEAPMLRALVQAGELPPVEQRLPREPKVLDFPDQEIGMYGGTWQSGFVGAARWWNAFAGIHGRTGLLSYSRDETEVQPSVAKSFDVVDGGKALVIRLREGLKWSDGHPFTADDIMFWYEDILLNKDIFASVPNAMLVGGRVFDLKKIDDYTVEFSFGGLTAPHFYHNLAARSWVSQPFVPKHFFQDLHVDYADPAELRARVREAGFQEWWQMLRSYWDRLGMERPDRPMDVPTLAAYVIVRRDPDVIFLERNPYYWKVDREGNQLPYIDRARVQSASDGEVLEAMAVAGQLDFYRGFAPRMSLYVASQQDVGNNVVMWFDPQGSRVTAQVNHTHKDPVMRELYNDKRFKQALSIAINREEMNDLIWLGLGEPRQFTLLPPSPYLEPGFVTAYAQYDPQEARRILTQEVGLRRDAAGNLLRPDGQRLRIDVEADGSQVDWVQGAELIAGYWSDLGIDARTQVRTPALHQEMLSANDLDMRIWGERAAPLYAYSNMDLFTPQQSTLGWRTWLESGGAAGIEPPDIVKQLRDWRDDFMTNPDARVRADAARNIFATHAEHLWRIGTVGNVPQPMVMSKDIANMPAGIAYDHILGWFGHGRPETFYLNNPARRRDGGHW